MKKRTAILGTLTLAAIAAIGLTAGVTGRPRTDVIPGLAWTAIQAKNTQLPSFEVMRTEVTVGMMLAFYAETGRADHAWYAAHELLDVRWPATDIDPKMANAFAKWAEWRLRTAGMIGEDEILRLPTDAEWSEMAGIDSSRENGTTAAERAKLSTTATLVGGAAEWPPAPEAGNFFRADDNPGGTAAAVPGPGDGYQGLAPVGSYPALENGTLDLAGNASELVTAEAGTFWVRGGSFKSGTFEEVRASARTAFTAVAPNLGFRLVRARK